MYPKDKEASVEINKCMAAIKAMSEEKQLFQKTKTYRSGVKLSRIKSAKLAFIKEYFSRFSRVERDKKKIGAKYKDTLPTAVNDRSECNYFLDEKIAVYTCIIGNYDSLNEPLIVPDNIDYFAITDFDIPKDSKWKRIDADSFDEVKGFTPALKNRFFKINPHIVFPEYKYSVYVDGNFKIYSDFTEHVNRMSKYGISHFKHQKRTSSYQEAEVCKMLHKESPEKIDAYIKRLRENNFPDDYGLLACDILVREHNKPECINVMQQWWYEFKTYVRRDQLSLPFVLFKNGIAVDDVATLGGDVHKDYSFEIVKHI